MAVGSGIAPGLGAAMDLRRSQGSCECEQCATTPSCGGGDAGRMVDGPGLTAPMERLERDLGFARA